MLLLLEFYHRCSTYLFDTLYLELYNHEKQNRDAFYYHHELKNRIYHTYYYLDQVLI